MEALLVPVIEKLADLLVEEVKPLKGICGEIKSLKEELEIIQPLLKDAEAMSEKGETSHTVKAWVNQIRVQADRIEKLVNNYRYHLSELQNEKRLTRYVGRVKYLMSRSQLASEIEAIKRSLLDIKGWGMGYGLRMLDRAGSSPESAGEDHVDPRVESLLVEDEDFVGFESMRGEVIDKLVKGPSEFLVISLVGQGGIGKTTLAKNVFDNRAVIRHFESARVWVTVSQPYNTKKILDTLADKLHVGPREETDTLEDLIGSLRNHLRTKRYLIVFDDVWEESFWDEIKPALPRKHNDGSRIVITTRNSSITAHCKNSPRDLVRHIRPWPQTPAFELFCKIAFGTEFLGDCPKELLESSMEIVSKCQGLPLVIAAIAGLAATKEKTLFEWETVLNNVKSKVKMSSELTQVHKILSLSYDDLPHSLRPCLVYMCLFPEDYSIADGRLYRFWTAEGFVKAEDDKLSEEVAEEYMAKLVRRNLVSLNQFETFRGEGDFFRVHDLMREVILSRAKDLSFFKIWDAKASKFRGNGRRLIISGDAKIALENVESSGTRTLFLSHTSEDHLTDSFMASLFQKMKHLEVLDFEGSRIEALPKELGKMLLLKYLSLWKTNVKSLPKSIGKLRNLYALDIRDTLITQLPEEINELKSLKHILAYRHNQSSKTTFGYVIGVSLQAGIGGNLVGLQTLTTVEARPGQMKELEKLERLRSLTVVRLTVDLTLDLCAAISKLKHLQELGLFAANETEPLHLQHVSPPPLGLRYVLLVGQLGRLPGWISELRSLRRVVLASSRLTGDAIEVLKDLPSLESILLGPDAYEGEELCFEEGGFLRLKSLMFKGLMNLRAVTIERGALVVLEQILIEECPMFQEVEVPSLQHLKHLNFAKVNGDFII